jgi:hypothetical protein
MGTVKQTFLGTSCKTFDGQRKFVILVVLQNVKPNLFYVDWVLHANCPREIFALCRRKTNVSSVLCGSTETFSLRHLTFFRNKEGNVLFGAAATIVVFFQNLGRSAEKLPTKFQNEEQK